ncbi:MAG: ribonuclease III, partial [Chloroflexi bacterium]
MKDAWEDVFSVDYEGLEEKLGFHFNDKALLIQALVHSSYVNENPLFPLDNNERLEFLGDAVLDFLVGDYLYHRFPEMREGDLTWFRASLVKGETLASFARKLGLGKFLLMGRGEEEGGGRERSTILGSAFEALVGALYLDKGLEAVRRFLEPFIEPELEHILREASKMDPKSHLQEMSQEWLGITPVYKTLKEKGPDHAKTFTVAVFIGDKIYGRGQGNSKHQASIEAAKAALRTLHRKMADDPSWRLPRRVRLALLEVLRHLKGIRRWAIAGSTASALSGLPITPHDIDIITDKKGARAISRRLEEFVILPLDWRENEQYASHFAQFKVEGVKVELMGDLRVKKDKTILRFNYWADVKEMPFGNSRVRVVPPEFQLVANLLIKGKEERAR